ncbi:MAG: Hsp20/alpha crystallin family protein [Dehalococcoidia bacterium]|nr:MAG: Hsp20/alpha crystallin family protein [Dehalococcoidia bacterium]
MPDTPQIRRQESSGIIPRRGQLLDWLLDADWPRPFGLAMNEAVPLDISRKNGDLVVRASMPGFDAKEIEVEVNDGVLTISAEHKEESEEKTEHFYRRERRSGSCSRIVALPEAVAEDQVSAEFKNGVLTVTAPVASKPKANKVTVRDSSSSPDSAI